MVVTQTMDVRSDYVKINLYVRIEEAK